ncbi:MAG: serine hydroxymethyltransferase [Clostridia bacterium]|nr:serine hydroxymethyltransferase [Clostridia bacterium]
MLKDKDVEIYELIKKEELRQKDTIELIASENVVSEEVMEAMGSVLTNKYAEGVPGNRYYGGCEYVDDIENLARDRVKKLFGAEHANVQPHSGASANLAAYFAILNPGDTVLAMALPDGGHLTHGSSVNISGKYFNFIHYPLGEDQRIDYEKLHQMAIEYKPKLIVAGASAYSRIIDFKRISEVAKEVGAYFMVDMAHIAGLVATGLHPSPVPYADIVTSTTHKTLRGPRGGIILCKSELSKKIDKAVFPGTQGGPLEHVIAGKAVCFGEALKPEFKAYCEQIIKNAKTFENYFNEHGIKMVTNGTDNHLLLLDLTEYGKTGKYMEDELSKLNIVVNKNTIPNEKLSPNLASGIRIGTPAITTRGFKEEDVLVVAEIITEVIKNDNYDYDDLSYKVRKLTEKYN